MPLMANAMSCSSLSPSTFNSSSNCNVSPSHHTKCWEAASLDSCQQCLKLSRLARVFESSALNKSQISQRPELMTLSLPVCANVSCSSSERHFWPKHDILKPPIIPYFQIIIFSFHLVKLTIRSKLSRKGKKHAAQILGKSLKKVSIGVHLIM